MSFWENWGGKVDKNSKPDKPSKLGWNKGDFKVFGYPPIRVILQVEVKDGGNLEEEEEAAGGCTLTRLIFPDLATTVVSVANH